MIINHKSCNNLQLNGVGLVWICVFVWLVLHRPSEFHAQISIWRPFLSERVISREDLTDFKSQNYWLCPQLNGSESCKWMCMYICIVHLQLKHVIRAVISFYTSTLGWHKFILIKGPVKKVIWCQLLKHYWILVAAAVF